MIKLRTQLPSYGGYRSCAQRTGSLLQQSANVTQLDSLRKIVYLIIRGVQRLVVISGSALSMELSQVSVAIVEARSRLWPRAQRRCSVSWSGAVAKLNLLTISPYVT